jgi:hypothetical protein
MCHRRGTRVIRFRRPAGFIEKAAYDAHRRAATLSRAELIDGKVRYTLDSAGQEIMWQEDDWAVLRSFWVEGVALTEVYLAGDGDVHYMAKEL